jgi:hypothetical protein
LRAVALGAAAREAVTDGEEPVPDIKPAASIRRFDVFAEFNRLKALSEGRSEDQAKGYGVWLAKVVAARRYGSSVTPVAPRNAHDRHDAAGAHEQEQEEEPDFKSVGGELQTDATFDREIVRRMGEPFYQQVFSPAIQQAFAEGKKYEQIRDAIRAEWKR